MNIKPREAVLKMPEYDPPLEGRRGKLRLDFNENPVGCSPKVLEMFNSLTREDIAIYPEYKKLNHKIANYFGVNKKEFLVTNGADEGIKLVLDTYISPKDEILLPVPTFSMFEIYASIIGCQITKVFYSSELEFPTEKLLEKISSRTKLIVIVNPNNPTGTTIKESNLKKILEITNEKGILVFLDEAYYDFYKNTMLSSINEYKNLVIARTFSKAYGLAGLRLGVLFSNSQNIIYLRRVLSPYSVNNLAVMAAIVALDDKEYVKNFSEMIMKNRAFVKDKLEKLNFKVYPSQTNFLIIDFGKACNYIENKLKERGILVRNRSNYPLLNNCLRIGIGTMDQCKQLLNAIREILEDWRRKD
jgi:histidinol-phosphate aminotransferase